jgi:flagellar hook-associated protein 2
MAISAAGIGSNLDVNSIVTQLMNIERQPLTLLDTKEAGFQAQLSGYGSLRGALSAFQTAVSALSDPAKFQASSATSSDTTILTATASQATAAGSYAANVTQLAQSQSLAAAGWTSASATIGSGAATTLTFQFGTISGGTLSNGVYTGASFTQDGSTATGTVTIDNTNNSLEGIRDAINAAGIGVTTSIVKDGGTAPYRLVLQGAVSGQASSMKITVTGDAGVQSLLGYDAGGTQNLTQTSTAQDAQLAINGVSISSASNALTDTLDGVTLTLNKIGTAKVIVAPDTSAVATAVQRFVKPYNDLNATLTDLTKFDASTNQAGALIGDATVRAVQSQIRNTLAGTLSGLGGSRLTVLSQVGLAFQRNGTLALDSTKLSQALASDPKSVAALFASVGRPNDSLINFVGSSDKTQAGSYDVQVNQLAMQGKLVASGVAGLTISAGVNDQLTLTVDGVSTTVTLGAGTYTASSLAAQVQAAINGASALSTAGVSVTVTQSGGVLTITSRRYGSASVVTAGGNAAPGLLGGSPTSTPGVDVAGTINGVTAGGSGRILSGATGTDVEGLKLEVTGGATGARGSVDFSHGYAQRLDVLLGQFLSGSGLLSGRTDGINRSIQDLGRQRDTFNTRLTSIEQRYRAQFTALDSLISDMKNTSNFLTQQLALLPGASGK